jgi:hypothetical protein
MRADTAVRQRIQQRLSLEQWLQLARRINGSQLVRTPASLASW